MRRFIDECHLARANTPNPLPNNMNPAKRAALTEGFYKNEAMEAVAEDLLAGHPQGFTLADLVGVGGNTGIIHCIRIFPETP